MSHLRTHVAQLAQDPSMGTTLQRRLGEALRKTSGGYPSASADMEGFLDALEHDLMLPYPALYNALGVEKNALSIRSRINRDGTGSILVKVPRGTELLFEVDPAGSVTVSGKIVGERIPPKKFPFRADSPGLHRGLQSDLVHYVEDHYPGTTYIYKVVGDGPVQTFKSVADLLRKYRQTGTETSSARRKELQGQPHLQGLVGPMYDGRDREVAVIRYDTQESYDRLTR